MRLAPLLSAVIGLAMITGANAQDPREVDALADCMVERSDDTAREAVRAYLMAALAGDRDRFALASTAMTDTMVAVAARCGISGDGFQQAHVNKALEQYGQRIAETVVTAAVTDMLSAP